MAGKQNYKVVGLLLVIGNLFVAFLAILDGVSKDWLIPLITSAIVAGYCIGISKKK